MTVYIYIYKRSEKITEEIRGGYVPENCREWQNREWQNRERQDVSSLRIVGLRS